MYLPVNQLHSRERSLLDRFRQGRGTGWINHPFRPHSLNNLATRFSARFDQLGAIQDLDEAIVLGREALDLDPQGHPDRSTSAINLANGLSTRYNQLGAVQDLDEAIVLDREALDLCPQGHPDREMSLTNQIGRAHV